MSWCGAGGMSSTPGVAWRVRAPGGGPLLQGAVPGVAVLKGTEPRGVLAALAVVALGTQPVHGDGDRLVGFRTEGADGHRRCRKAMDELRDGLDLLQGHRRAWDEGKHIAQRSGSVAIDVGA